jgi:hypothetical protein
VVAAGVFDIFESNGIKKRTNQVREKEVRRRLTYDAARKKNTCKRKRKKEIQRCAMQAE